MPCFTFANVKLPYNNFVLFCFRWQNMYVYLILISKSLRNFAFPVAKLLFNIFTIFTLCMFLYVYFTKSLNAVEANMKFKSNISWCWKLVQRNIALKLLHSAFKSCLCRLCLRLCQVYIPIYVFMYETDCQAFIQALLSTAVFPQRFSFFLFA